ncbi:hypothetical protein C8Q76DRAFT_755519 [Earliella scabrosa]|nr:hypothetical protein C8Q76DRAFT_755519 [Earliella scabrosa]
MYRDNATTTIFPQDANWMVVLCNLTTSPGQVASVGRGLTKNQIAIRPVAPLGHDLALHHALEATAGGLGLTSTLTYYVRARAPCATAAGTDVSGRSRFICLGLRLLGVGLRPRVDDPASVCY